jgi:uncharacterized membrane protein
VVASIDRADNSKFLEQFRYTIIASQLLSGTSILGHRPAVPSVSGANSDDKHDQSLLSTEGIIASILGALAIAVVLSWVLGNAPSYVTRKRLAFLLVLCAAAAFLGQIYMRRQWLRYRRMQSLAEIATFVSNSNDFDSASEATLSLVQEVELVSRGYRMYAAAGSYLLFSFSHSPPSLVFFFLSSLHHMVLTILIAAPHCPQLPD